MDRRFSARFGLAVRRHRMSLGLSQETLAEKADVHRTYVGLLERGLRSSGLDVAVRIARALDVPLSRMIAEIEKETGRR